MVVDVARCDGVESRVCSAPCVLCNESRCVGTIIFAVSHDESK